LTVAATVQQLSVVSSSTAASSVAVQSFVWEPVWISTATSFLSRNSFDTWFDWTTWFAAKVVAWVKSIVVAVGGIIDLRTGQEKSEEGISELTFDGAGVSGTVIGIQRVTRISKVNSGSVSWSIGDFPWDTRFTGGFGVDDSTLISVSKSLAESIDFIDRGTFSTSDVVIEVAPTSVFVELVESESDVSGESPQ